MSQTTTTIIIGLLIFGIAYALVIAIKPFKPGLTWLSVVIGDGATDIGAFLFIYHLSGDWKLALIPLFCHILTGGPMILGQILKHHFEGNAADDLMNLMNGDNEKE